MVFTFTPLSRFGVSNSVRFAVLLVNKQTLHIKVTDFGLAKVQYGRMPFSSQCGTPNYGKLKTTVSSILNE